MKRVTWRLNRHTAKLAKENVTAGSSPGKILMTFGVHDVFGFGTN